MDKPQLILGLFTTVFGVLLLWVIIPAQHLPPMMSTVSPAFYPNIGTVIMLVGGIGMVVSGIKGKSVSVDVGSIVKTIRFCCLMAALFGVTLVAFKFLNFVAGGIVLVFIAMWLLGERRPGYLVLVSLVSPVFIWFCISGLLGRGLP